MKAFSERYYVIINRNNQKIIEGDKCKRLRGIKIDNKLQHSIYMLKTCAKGKMHVFVTATLHISISKRRIQWTFVIANMTSNKFSATSKNFHSPIILGHDNSYNIPLYIEYRFL